MLFKTFGLILGHLALYWKLFRTKRTENENQNMTNLWFGILIANLWAKTKNCV